jgi:hypothetical protein
MENVPGKGFLDRAMAGLLAIRFSEEPTSRRGWLRSAYILLCWFYNMQNAPGDSEMLQDGLRTKLKVIRTKLVLEALRRHLPIQKPSQTLEK